MFLYCFLIFIIIALSIFALYKHDSVVKINETQQQIKETLENRIQELSQEKIHLDEEVISLKARKNELYQKIEDFEVEQEKAKKIAAEIFKNNMNLANEKFDRATEKLSQTYQTAVDSYNKEYLKIMAEATATIHDDIISQNIKLQTINQELQKAKQKEKTIVQALKRTEEEKNKTNFYKLILSEVDLNEIKQLREVAAHLRNQEPLNKAIWKTYYEKPFTDLIGRIIGEDTITGIYRITNIASGKVYVGQSTDIKARLRSHIKRGLGAETPTRNKLYTAMRADGVENFSYEVLEKCSREELNDEERYWIKFYKAQEFGYNETAGGS